jgi:hypothetical protein
MHRLIGVGVLLVLPVSLGGCDWLGWGGSSTNSEKARPGAERQFNATNTLPAARGGSYDAAVTPVDENRGGPGIGSVVPAKGGQKAQKEAADKEAAERDAKAREERERSEREAALRKAQEKAQDGDKKTGGGPVTPPADGTPAPAADATPATSAPAPAPVTTAPLDATPAPPPTETKQ